MDSSLTSLLLDAVSIQFLIHLLLTTSLDNQVQQYRFLNLDPSQLLFGMK